MRHSCIAYALFSDWVLDSRAIIYQDRFEADTRSLAGARVIWYGNYWTAYFSQRKQPSVESAAPAAAIVNRETSSIKPVFLDSSFTLLYNLAKYTKSQSISTEDQ